MLANHDNPITETQTIRVLFFTLPSSETEEFTFFAGKLLTNEAGPGSRVVLATLLD